MAFNNPRDLRKILHISISYDVKNSFPFRDLISECTAYILP